MKGGTARRDKKLAVPCRCFEKLAREVRLRRPAGATKQR